MTNLSWWSEARMGQLEALYRKGLSFSLIAAEIGVTRGAAIGKAHRMRLPKRVEIVACKARPPRVNPPPKRRRTIKVVVMEQPEPAIDPDHDYRCTIYDLVDCSCRWPLWKSSAVHEQRFYCGVPTASVSAGVPYCRRHSLKVFAQRLHD